MQGHDIVVIGASSGGIEALVELLPRLPSDLQASILLVVHTLPSGRTFLANVLSKKTTLKVKSARNGETLRCGYIYTAPADHHLLVNKNGIVVTHGPAVNKWRPAVDPLFRSAAAHYSSRVIGIILSGSLDDGTAGLAAVKAAGGIALVQDARDASFPEMPQNAMLNTHVDYSLTAREIGEIIPQLVAAAAEPVEKIPPEIIKEAALEEKILSSGNDLPDDLGTHSIFTCPDCGGSLWEIEDGLGHVHYRCYLGHSFTENYLLDKQNDQLEKALYSALRIMEERSRLYQRMINLNQQTNNSSMSDIYKEKKQEIDNNTNAIRNLLLTSGRQKEN